MHVSTSHSNIPVADSLGARAYYMRNIFHNWPDEKRKLILAKIKPAMTAESVIIIDEMMIPTRNASWQQI